MVSCSPVEVPELGAQYNHVSLDVITYFRMSVPEFHTSKVCEGTSSPCTEVSVKTPGVRSMVASGGPTVSVTRIVWGLFVASESVMVMLPVYVPSTRFAVE